VGFVVEVALGQVFSKYFGFPCQFAFHRLLHNHLSSGAGTVGQTVLCLAMGWMTGCISQQVYRYFCGLLVPIGSSTRPFSCLLGTGGPLSFEAKGLNGEAGAVLSHVASYRRYCTAISLYPFMAYGAYTCTRTALPLLVQREIIFYVCLCRMWFFWVITV
jgi:hypothetical protein